MPYFKPFLEKYIVETRILKNHFIFMLKISHTYFCAHLVILVGIGAIRLADGYSLNELNMTIEQVITAAFSNVEIKELLRTLKIFEQVFENLKTTIETIASAFAWSP